MPKKFKLLKTDTKVVFGTKLFRLQATMSFGDVKKGDLGGYVERESNLSHDGNAWVYGDAQVYGNARVSGNAQVSGNAWVYGDAQVYGNAWVYGDAQVYGNAWVYGNAQVYGNAWVISHITKDMKDIRASLYAQTFHLPDPEGYVVLFKRVNKTRKKTEWMSEHDPSFKYVKGKVAEVENPDESHASCSSGLHVSYATYWQSGNTLIAVRVHIDDIITVQEGKARCRKVFVLGEVPEII